MTPRRMGGLAVLLTVGVLLGVASAATAPTVLVLRNGTSLEVATARLQGDLVYVTFANGRMQAYATEDVNLEASGLAPKAAPEPAAQQQAPPPGSLAAARSSDAALGKYTITDKDVAHVSAAKPEEGEKKEESAEEGKGAAASLLISDLRRNLSGTTLSVTGTVTNNGQKPVSSITLEANAVDGEGKNVGKGTTVISQELKPKQAVGFSLGFEVAGAVADVRVQAVAAVANFDFKPVEPPGPAPGEEGAGGEGAQAAAQAPPSGQQAAANEEKPPQQPPSPNQWAPQGSAANQWAPTAPVNPAGGSGG